MRGWSLGLLGAVVIATLALALMENHQRAGPYDEPLQPLSVVASASGTYHARGAAAPVAGLCLQPPCEAATDVALRLVGLPDVPLEARLEMGPNGGPARQLGELRREGGAHVLRWSAAEDHTAATRLVLALAGADVASLAVRPTPEPMRLDGPIQAAWPAPAGRVRLAEVGGAVISTLADVRLEGTAPAGWRFEAQLEGRSGVRGLGALDSVQGDSVLDARVERMKLEHQERLVVLLVPDRASPAEGFPVLEASFPPGR